MTAVEVGGVVVGGLAVLAVVGTGVSSLVKMIRGKNGNGNGKAPEVAMLERLLEATERQTGVIEKNLEKTICVFHQVDKVTDAMIRLEQSQSATHERLDKLITTRLP